MRPIAITNNDGGAFKLHTPHFPSWNAFGAYLILNLFATIFPVRQKIDWADACLLLQWYLVDMVNLPTDNYWLPGFQISLIVPVLLSTLFLPGRSIFPYMLLQVITVGL